MTATILGTVKRAPDGSSCELRVFQGDQHLATLLDTALPHVQVRDQSDSISYCEAELVSETGFAAAALRKGARVEVWSSWPGREARMQFSGTIDYLKVNTSEGEPAQATFQARGLAASLVDAPFKGQLAGSVASVVTALVERSGLRARTEYPETQLSIWIDADSSYAALRLLATNLRGVVRVRDDLVELVSNEAFDARLRDAPRFVIPSENIESSEIVQGRPIRKR